MIKFILFAMMEDSMDRIKRFLNNYWIYIVAFIVPWIIAIVQSFVMDTWLTGNGSFLTGDTSQQLVPFAYELWEKVHSGDSFLYTWNLAAGCDFNAVTAYFLSPFTLLFLIFPKSWIPNMMQIIMILKWAFTSFTMVYFFYNTKHNILSVNKKIVSLFLGMAFALGNGIVNNLHYIQFGDIMICFPLVLLLIEEMVEKKHWKRYYLLLTFCIISNAYMSFSMCLFLIMWFVMQLNKNTTEKWKKFFVFAGSSVLAALTSVFIVLPSVVISQERLQTTDMNYAMAYITGILLTPVKFIKQLFMFSNIFPPQKIEPNIYFSVIGVVLVFLFVFIKIGRKRKTYMSVVFILLTASFFIGALSIIWHLFNVPNGVYHRFSYIYNFMTLFIVLYVLIHLEDIKILHILLVGILCIFGFVYTFLGIDTYSSFVTYLVTIMVLVLYLMLLFLYCKKSITYKGIVMVVCIIGILEVVTNAGYSFRIYNSSSYSKTDENFMYAKELSEMAIDMNAGERVTAANTISNVNLLSDKPSASGFVSSLNGRFQYLYDRLGMGVNGDVEYSVKGASPLVNLMMNVRYGIGCDEMDFADAELVKEKGDYQLYKMKRLASLGYMVDSDILNWDISSKPCFDIQNSFVEITVGGSPIFTRVEPKLECTDIKGNVIERDEHYEKNGAYVYNCTTLFGNEYDSIQTEFEVEEDMDLYMFSYSIFNAGLYIFVDDEMQHRDSRSFRQGTYHLGNVKKGQKITIVALADEYIGKDVDLLWFLRFAKFDEEAYAKSYEKLSKNVYNIEVMESDYVKGFIHADEDGIMMTSIQAVDGFTVLVDGVEVPYETIGGAMIGVPLTAGDHIVEFKYRTPHLTFGIVISACAFSLFLLICLFSWKRKKSSVSQVENLGEV